jgi:hypothetical protein
MRVGVGGSQSLYIAAPSHIHTPVFALLCTSTSFHFPHIHTYIHLPTFAPRHSQVPKQPPATLEQDGRWHLSPAHVIHQDVHSMPLCQGDHAADVCVCVYMCVFM